MTVLFASDLHLGHKLAAKLRGFDSVEAHDDSIINTLNKFCAKRTLLWILGDAAFNKEALFRLKEIKGVKKLVRGNHDQEKLSDYCEVFDNVHGFLKYKNLWLSHCPIHPQEMYRVNANVHGHIHKDAVTTSIGFPYINVNWDFWKRPLTFDEIRAIVLKGKSNGN